MSAGGVKRPTVGTSTELCRWVCFAACADHADLPWISDAHQVSTVDWEAMAKVCAGCPVLASCVAAAERFDVQAGYWAGQHRNTGAPVALEWVAQTSTRTPQSTGAGSHGWEQGAFAWASLDGAP